MRFQFSLPAPYRAFSAYYPRVDIKGNPWVKDMGS
jgi:hypothetical protein